MTKRTATGGGVRYRAGDTRRPHLTIKLVEAQGNGRAHVVCALLGSQKGAFSNLVHDVFIGTWQEQGCAPWLSVPHRARTKLSRTSGAPVAPSPFSRKIKAHC